MEKRPKLAWSKLQKSKCQGGVQLLNLTAKQKALKCSWVQILNSDPKLADLVYTTTAPILRENLFRCNVKANDAEHVLDKDCDLFWKEMFIAWCEINFDSSKHPNDQLLWCNSLVRVGNKPYILVVPFSRGLKYYHQLKSENGLIGIKEAWEKYSLNFVEFNAIVQAVPSWWRMKGEDGVKMCLYDRLQQTKKLASLLYRSFLDLQVDNSMEKINSYVDQ